MEKLLHGRETYAVDLEPAEAESFLEDNSSYPTLSRIPALISMGLRSRKDDKLVAVIQFCAPRTKAMQRKYSIELLRLAFKRNVRVRGGASKLVEAYKKKYKPADIFTYQDTTGEATAVYEHCGFTLVKQEKKKGYLVAPGKTLATANRKAKELLTMPYATKWGPDAILGTKLGEVYREDGTRKSNKALFLEELGWHVEETTGDRVYEWFNSELTFYTYKITATDSDKYYYGVSHAKRAEATLDECLTDGYFGSGGKKFQHWKARHQSTLLKEVISLHATRAEAYAEEEALVGDSWRTDPLCLNSIAGGAHSATNFQRTIQGVAERWCEVHGRAKFTGMSCFKCLAATTVQELDCIIHGPTKHRGSTCYRCVSDKSITQRACPIHGFTPFKGSACAKCVVKLELRECAIHGLVKHRGASCYQCVNSGANTLKECPIHGVGSHKGDACYACFVAGHEERACESHGITKHRNGQCLKCAASERVSEGECPEHGVTLLIGSLCGKCKAAKTVTTKECAKHGLTKHKGDVCYKCEITSLVGEDECPTHGVTKFRSGNCCKCHNEKQNSLRECELHGLVKHRGAKCSTCLAQKSRHTRFHEAKQVDDCTYCAG